MKILENYSFYVKVKESLKLMITNLEKDIKKKKSNPIKSDIQKYLYDLNHTNEYQKNTWFKGSRYR